MSGDTNYQLLYILYRWDCCFSSFQVSKSWPISFEKLLSGEFLVADRMSGSNRGRGREIDTKEADKERNVRSREREVETPGIAGPGRLRCHAYTQGQIRRAGEYVPRQEPEEPAALVPQVSSRERASERRETLRGALSGSCIPVRRHDARR